MHEDSSNVFLIRLNNIINLAKCANERPLITSMNICHEDKTVSQGAAGNDHEFINKQTRPYPDPDPPS